ncbi:MAG: ankyrin repeat domain-containing protein [Spirochaetes bacterium]|jgi:tetratricopeptide (TPR) repeat protein|nr:ankyrin repeat domain-containing protein [Spirochaetota bacterium]
MKSLKKFKSEAEKHADDMNKLSEIIGVIANGEFPAEYSLFACELCDVLLGRNASDFQTRYRRGYLLFKADSYADAIEEFNYVITHNKSRSSGVLYDRARAYFHTGNNVAALEDIDRLFLEIDSFVREGFSPDLLHILKGMILYKDDEYNGALAEFLAARVYSPDNKKIADMIVSARSEAEVKEQFMGLVNLLKQSDIETFMTECVGFDSLDYSIHSESGRTLLHFAADMGLTEVLKFLMDQGATVDVEADGSLCAIHLAALRYDIDSVLLLMQAGADIYRPVQIEGGTLLNYLVHNKKTDEIADLVEAGADLNQQIPGCGTPLHVAVSKNNRHAVKELLRLGADMNMPDEEKITPFDIAIENGYIEIEDIFRELM